MEHKTWSIPLKRPTLMTGGLIISIVITAIYGLGVGAEVMPRLLAHKPLNELWQAVIGFLVFSAALISIVSTKLYIRRKPLSPIVFSPDYLTLPVDAESNKVHQISYYDIISLTIQGSPALPHILLETRKHLYRFSADLFVDPENIQRFINTLKTQIYNLPQGEQVLVRMQEQQKFAEHTWTKRPLVMQIITAALLVFFALLYSTQALESPLGILGFGANAPSLSLQGEWFRLAASVFLHNGFFEIFLCGIITYFLGSYVERLLGHFTALSIFLTSTFVAALVTAKFAHGMFYQGAWAGIYGFLGSFLVLHQKQAIELPPGFRQPRRFWLNVCLLSLVLPFLISNLHPYMQLTGFIVGALITFLHSKNGMRILAAVMSIVFIFSLAQSVHYAARFDADAEVSVAQKLIASPTMHANELNNLAWLLSTDKQTPERLLQVAQQSARQAVNKTPDQDAYVDTLATTHYRLKQFDQAIALESALFEKNLDSTTASQLLRFLNGQNSRVTEVNFQLRKEGKALEVTFLQPLQQPVLVYVLAKSNQDLLGFIRLVLIPTSEKTLQLENNTFTQNATLVIAKVQPLTTTHHNASWDYWPIEPAIEALP